MKQGLDIHQLAQKIVDQNESKRDFVVPTTAISVFPQYRENGPMAIAFPVPGKKKSVTREFSMNRFMLGQIAQHTKIPMQVVDLLLEGTPREREELGQLLSVRLNENETVRMIRTMEEMEFGGDGPIARAFLSDKYRRLDNFDLAGAVFPIMRDLGDSLEVKSSEITDERMYIKVVHTDMSFDLGETRDLSGAKVGDIIEAGIVVSNSEVGSGSLRIEPFIYRLVCLNGMISNDHTLRKNHVGRQHQLEGTDYATELFSDETLSLDDAALFSKTTDVVRATLTNEDKFMKIATRLFEAKGEPITGQPQAAVVELGRRFQLNETDTNGILDHLIKGRDLSKFGIANAVTAYARDDEGRMTYDESTNLEYLGGKVIELGAAEWKVIASATIESKGGKRK